MSRDLTVNNETFPYPDPGDEPGWGEPASDWAEEVTNVLANLLGPDDILETTFTIANNVAVASNITGLAFDTGSARQAIITYSIYRVTDSVTSGNAESGQILLIYDNNAAPGSKWSLAQSNIVGLAGVNFSITDAGQVQYTSSNISGANYSGVMKFSAKSLGQ